MEVQTQHHSSNPIFFKNRFNILYSNQRKRRRREMNNQQLLPQVHTGLRLSSNEDQTQQISHHLKFISSSSECYNRQNEELNIFLHTQAEELRRRLAERRKVHYKALLDAVEESLVRKLKEKDAEIEKATRFHNELVARDAQLRAETQAWQERAKAQEAAAESLQAQLQHSKCASGRGLAQDSREVEGGLLTGTSGLDDAESAYVDPERIRRPRCKACRKREATVVVLPCWHLSICPECDRTSLVCPLCLTLQNSSVQALFC